MARHDRRFWQCLTLHPPWDSLVLGCIDLPTVFDCRADSKLDFPPYSINNLGTRAPLSVKTITASARHANGWAQYDTHNLYGFGMVQVGPRRQHVWQSSSFV
jgi:hypothetical protein